MQLTVGRIVRPHGVRGEVLVDVRTDDPELRFAAGSVLSTERGPLTVEYARGRTVTGGRLRLIVAFAEIGDRDAAEDARGAELSVDSAEVVEPDDPDEFHDHQLIGLTAVDADGAVLGEVVRIDHLPASDLLAVRRPDGHEALVPFVSALVPEVRVADGQVVLAPPEGLLDL